MRILYIRMFCPKERIRQVSHDPRQTQKPRQAAILYDILRQRQRQTRLSSNVACAASELPRQIVNLHFGALPLEAAKSAQTFLYISES